MPSNRFFSVIKFDFGLTAALAVVGDFSLAVLWVKKLGADQLVVGNLASIFKDDLADVLSHGGWHPSHCD